MKKTIAITAIVVALLFLGFQLYRTNNNIEQANETAERAVDLAEETQEAIGNEVSKIIENVDTEGLSSGIKEIGNDLKEKIKKKINE